MFRDIIGLLFQYVAPPDDDPGAPSPFAFSEPGTLKAALDDAGFANVEEQPATLPTFFPGDPQRWWNWLVDTAAPVQTWMAAMTDADRKQATSEILAALAGYHDGHAVNVPIEVIVATGDKTAAR